MIRSWLLPLDLYDLSRGLGVGFLLLSAVDLRLQFGNPFPSQFVTNKENDGGYDGRPSWDQHVDGQYRLFNGLCCHGGIQGCIKSCQRQYQWNDRTSGNDGCF